MENKMKLSDFVATTLKEIIDGVESAQKYAKEHGATINPHGAYQGTSRNKFDTTFSQIYPITIDFDILLTLAQDDKGQGGVGIFAAAFGLGVKGEMRDYVENATRVKFQIMAQLPRQK